MRPQPGTTIRSAASIAILSVCAAAAACSMEISAPPDGDVPGLPAPVEEHLSEAQRAAYHEDAVRLALRHLEGTGAGLDDILPPEDLVTSLYRALVAVSASSSAARDSVVELYRVHSFPRPETRELLVRIDPAHAWTAAWKALQAETGNASIDALVTTYDLTVRDYYSWSIGEYVVIRAGRPLNAAALGDALEGIAGVLLAEPNGSGGDGNDIRAALAGSGWRLDYSVGFGDCPAGCIDRHTWSFAVSGAGGVTFLGSAGPPPPPPPGQP